MSFSNTGLFHPAHSSMLRVSGRPPAKSHEGRIPVKRPVIGGGGDKSRIESGRCPASTTLTAVGPPEETGICAWKSQTASPLEDGRRRERPTRTIGQPTVLQGRPPYRPEERKKKAFVINGY